MINIAGEQTAKLSSENAVDPGPVAVIDIGTNSLRMAIAEVSADGDVRTLEKLYRPVSLGKDTFTSGGIRKRTIEQCVKVLKNFLRLLGEYHITRPEQMRVVATSAVREASNRLAFVDRVFSATGIEIEILDEAEVTRTTFLGVLPYIQERTDLMSAPTVVVEVGGGSTEVLILENCDVTFSHSYRLGSLRLTETLDNYHTPTGQTRRLMENQIQRTLDSVKEPLKSKKTTQMLAIGGDIRWAADQMFPNRVPGELIQIKVTKLAEQVDDILSMSVDQIVSRHHLSYPDAETLGPALLAYLQLAKQLGLSTLLVSDVNLRNGLLRDMGHRGPWSAVLKRQIINSALDLARKFDVDESHALHVAHLASTLFHAYRDEHQLDPRYELVLYLAALLHESGLYISQNSFHKHTMYLLRNSELFGLGKTDLLLTALVARYHRRASPKPTHDAYGNLSRERRVAVSKMSALLRVADALDRSRSQHIDELMCSKTETAWVLTIPNLDDLSLEKLALQQKGSLFSEIFGAEIVLRRLRR